MWLFAQKLNRGTGSIGEQWVDAVNTYHVTAGNWDVLDEKVMLQATMYGPPWARFQAPVDPEATPTPTTHLDGSLEVASGQMNPTITTHELDDGRTWWDVGGQTLSVEHRSIQPLATRDVTIPGKHARDPFITSLTVDDLPNKKPARARSPRSGARCSSPTRTSEHLVAGDPRHRPRVGLRLESQPDRRAVPPERRGV